MAGISGIIVVCIGAGMTLLGAAGVLWFLDKITNLAESDYELWESDYELWESDYEL